MKTRHAQTVGLFGLVVLSAAGVQNVWTSDFTRDGCHLWPQLWWKSRSKYRSYLAKETPIAVGFNSQDISPVALACSEAFDDLEFGLYADDRTCEIVGRCEFFTRAVSARKDYEVSVLHDTFGKAVGTQDVAAGLCRLAVPASGYAQVSWK